MRSRSRSAPHSLRRVYSPPSHTQHRPPSRAGPSRRRFRSSVRGQRAGPDQSASARRHSGSGPLRVAVGQSRVFVNGKPDERLPRDAFRGVCVRIDNRGFSPGDDVGLTYQLQLTVGNGGRSPPDRSSSTSPTRPVQPSIRRIRRICAPATIRIHGRQRMRARIAIADSDGSPGETVALDGRHSSDADPGTSPQLRLEECARRADRNRSFPAGSPLAGRRQRHHAHGDRRFLRPATNSSTDTVTITVGCRRRSPREQMPGRTRPCPTRISAAGENVTLNGAESSDPDGTIVSYVWRNAAGAQIATGRESAGATARRRNTITLTVT